MKKANIINIIIAIIFSAMASLAYSFVPYNDKWFFYVIALAVIVISVSLSKLNSIVSLVIIVLSCIVPAFEYEWRFLTFVLPIALILWTLTCIQVGYKSHYIICVAVVNLLAIIKASPFIRRFHPTHSQFYTDMKGHLIAMIIIVSLSSIGFLAYIASIIKSKATKEQIFFAIVYGIELLLFSINLYSFVWINTFYSIIMVAFLPISLYAFLKMLGKEKAIIDKII